MTKNCQQYSAVLDQHYNAKNKENVPLQIYFSFFFQVTAFYEPPAAHFQALKSELDDLGADVSDAILREAGFDMEGIALAVPHQEVPIEEQETIPGDIETGDTYLDDFGTQEVEATQNIDPYLACGNTEPTQTKDSYLETLALAMSGMEVEEDQSEAVPWR